MRTGRAAPGELGGELRAGDLSGGAAIIPLPAHNLPAAVIERLHGAGIRSCRDWSRLSRSQKRGIWGITRKSVELIDAAIARAVPS